MRNKYIIGNWKMNKTSEEASSTVNLIKARLIDTGDINVVICPPFTALDKVGRLTLDSNIAIGAQNVHYIASGAYTGEISIDMLKDLKVTYCIIGHSERRQYFGETNESVNKKLKALLDNNIFPVLCVGESKEIRDSGNHKEFVEMQIREALDGIDARKVEKCIIAYEPIWAIGTGVSASTDEAQDMCEFIRYTIKKMFGEELANNTAILYGGSVNLTNVEELFGMSDIDGALVGGASLKPEFVDMVLAVK